MERLLWLWLLGKVVVSAILAGLAGFAALPIVLAEITRRRGRKEPTCSSSLYVGRVWHTRLQPKHHGFQYPLFVFALDLEEVDELFADRLWPLSWIVSFRKQDHLKNGEGRIGNNDNQEKCETANSVLRLVAEKTQDRFRPSLATHRVILVTHLCYYGYCFNPVSIYYIQEKKATHRLVTVVLEVSNTPWNEMHCYVLHPESVDQVQRMVNEKDKTERPQQPIQYIWPKRFHVSPFMEMNYLYDWTFTNFQLQQPGQDNGQDNDDDGDPLLVRAAMKRDDHQVVFTAKVECLRKGLHPHTIAWQLVHYPIYCFILQLWIHYEAFWLFVKGIAFVPHPNDTDTAISVAIGAIMTPLFALKAWLDRRWKQPEGKSSSTVSGDKHGGKAKKN